MDMLRLGDANTTWNLPTYSLNVRGTRYLWGSDGLTRDLTFGKDFILHVVNDLGGSPVMLGTRVASGTITTLGTLQPGECVSIPINNISGVYAECVNDTLLHCSIY